MQGWWNMQFFGVKKAGNGKLSPSNRLRKVGLIIGYDSEPLSAPLYPEFRSLYHPTVGSKSRLFNVDVI